MLQRIDPHNKRVVNDQTLHLWINFRYPPAVWRAPYRGEELEDKHLKQFDLSEFEWLETSVHHDFEAGLTRDGMINRRADLLLEWSLEQRLRGITDYWGMLIHVRSLTARNSMNKRIDLADVLKQTLAYSGYTARNAAVRGGDMIHFFVEVRAENPLVRKNAIDRYFRMVRDNRHYLVWGSMAMAISNGYIPKRWISQYLATYHDERPSAQRRGRELLLSIVAGTVGATQIDDGQCYFALRTMIRRCEKDGTKKRSLAWFHRGLDEARRAARALPKAMDFQCNLFHAYITPTKILLEGPYNEISNRVLRKHAKNITHFMRGTFCSK